MLKSLGHILKSSPILLSWPSARFKSNLIATGPSGSLYLTEKVIGQSRWAANTQKYFLIRPCRKEKSTTSETMAREADGSCLKVHAPGGDRTRDLRITSPAKWAAASTAYKFDALTNCATGADCRPGTTAAINSLRPRANARNVSFLNLSRW